MDQEKNRYIAIDWNQNEVMDWSLVLWKEVEWGSTDHQGSKKGAH